MNCKTADEIAEKLLDYPESEWNRLINEWCKNEDLKREVSELAYLNRNARNFVEEFQRRIYTITRESLANGDNDPKLIAGYRVLKKLGSGSSASVFLIEKPDGQKGALKLLRGIPEDSYSRQRFESEQHILGSLNHPNIARIYEGGITENGVPYVIMEYIDGIPIDRWSDQNRLGIKERINLFQTVCQAVHYAHQNLVVHRDIKPDHVLITQSGEIKLIDFGIAKLLEPSGPEITGPKTRTGMRVMTPEFASPEQVKGEPVTTSSDIYSLGVLLYQVVTGRRPYEFNTNSLLEIERVVCENKLMKPSDIVISNENLPAQLNGLTCREIARLRGFEPSRLSKILSGDLDRIILKAMRQEPAQRYASALSFAEDLENHLRGDPVAARAPTFRYRARKFFYRHKWPVAAAAIVVLSLTAGLIGTIWQNHQARMHAERAETQAQIAGQVTEFLINLFESADPTVTQGAEITIHELLDRGVEQAFEPNQDASIQLNLLSVLGRVYSNMGVHNKSARLFEAALEKAATQNPPDLLFIADLQAGLGLNMRLMGNLAGADSLYHEALKNRRSRLGENHPLTIRSLDEWAGVHAYLSRDADLADSLFQDVVNRRRAALDPFDKDLAESLNNLAYIKMTKREYHNAQQFYEESSEIYRVALGEHHPDRLRTMNGLAVAYHRTGNFGRSEQMYNTLIESRKSVLGEAHPQVAVSYHHLAELLKDTGRPEQAVSVIQKAVIIMENLDAPHQFFPDILFSKADLYDTLNYPDAAKKAFHRTAQTCMEIRGVHSPGCSRILQTTGEFFLKYNEYSAAQTYFQHAYDGLSLRLDPGHDQLVRLSALIESAR